MKVLNHHIYEYKKGLRSLVLHTMNSSRIKEAETKLNNNNIKYIIRIVSENKINIFFGNPDCINIINSFGNKALNKFTPEQDFILGIMLGYGREQQYKRYIKQCNQKNDIKSKDVA